MQLYPSKPLAPYISHYLIIEEDIPGKTIHRFFPDGHPGMIFHYGDAFKQQLAGSDLVLQHAQSLVYGQVNQYFNLISGKKIGMLIVVFKPYGLAAFTGIGAKELTNQNIPLPDIFGRETERLTELVKLGKSHSERIRIIENFLLKNMNGTPENLSLIQACIEKSDAGKGQLSVQKLAKDLSVSERTIERTFDLMVGISPKKYGRVIRLQHYLKLRKRYPDSPLTSLGYEAGYYDQAHFIREFTSLTGLTPKQYDRNKNRLAVNLMQITAV